MAKRTTAIFEWLRTCPHLSDLWSIAARNEDGVRVVLPQGSSDVVTHAERRDVTGMYECEIIPNLSIYEDYQINCYESYDTAEDTPPSDNINVLKYEDVQKVCEWIEEQDNNENFPEIGEFVISVEVNPFVPQIGFIDPTDGTIRYFITLRIRYLNSRKRRYRMVEYDDSDD